MKWTLKDTHVSAFREILQNLHVPAHTFLTIWKEAKKKKVNNAICNCRIFTRGEHYENHESEGVSEVNAAIREIAGGNKGNNSKNWT